MNLQREPLREAICRTLTNAIVAGELAPDARIRLIPTAEKLGVSMTPLREALVQLEVDGLVYGDPGCGYSVSPLSREEIEEIYPFLGGLEALAVDLGPPSNEDLVVLEELNRHLAVAATGRQAFELDKAWHQRIVMRCSNQSVLDTLTKLRRRAARYEAATISEFYENLQESVEQHSRVLGALRHDDLAGAGRILRENWSIPLKLLRPKVTVR